MRGGREGDGEGGREGRREGEREGERERGKERGKEATGAYGDRGEGEEREGRGREGDNSDDTSGAATHRVLENSMQSLRDVKLVFCNIDCMYYLHYAKRDNMFGYIFRVYSYRKSQLHALGYIRVYIRVSESRTIFLELIALAMQNIQCFTCIFLPFFRNRSFLRKLVRIPRTAMDK